MKHPAKLLIFFLPILAALCLSSPCGLWADDALFIGNSFTFGGAEKIICQHGGVPKLVEAIAASKKKNLSTLMLTAPGRDWGFHLRQPKTEEDLNAKIWNWVVLQDFSTQPTHIGKPDDFFNNGETLDNRIMQHSPKAIVVLYETWARPKGNPLYTGISTPRTFVDTAQMNDEVQKHYTELYQRLEAINPPTHVELAPVGLAFERSVEKYPDINLYCSDLYHANTNGSYLAALVIYATIYKESPVGAPHEFFGLSLNVGAAAKLQEIANEVTSQKVQQRASLEANSAISITANLTTPRTSGPPAP